MTNTPTPPPAAPDSPVPSGEPQYAAPAYAQAPGGYYAAPSTPTNVLAVVSMISSILGFFAIPIVGSIAGVVMGHIARKQIVQTGEQGAGMAKAGLIVGYVGLGLWVLGIIAYIAFFVIIIAASSTSGY
jgi:hypothetical protein